MARQRHIQRGPSAADGFAFISLSGEPSMIVAFAHYCVDPREDRVNAASTMSHRDV